jgi:hypothetical protein
VIQSAPQHETALITVFAETDGLLSRLQPHLAGRDYATVAGWREFESSVRDALVGLVAVRQLDSAIVRWLNESHGLDSIAQLVLVADLSTEAVRILLGSDSSQMQMVWWEEVDRVLTEVLDEVSSDPLGALCSALLSHHDLSPLLERAVKESCLSPIPPATVKKLSKRTGVPQTTLYSRWRAELPGYLPKDLLSWAILLRALTEADRSRWVDVADTLDIYPRTLERLSHRMAGMSLAVAASHPDAVWRAFRLWTRRWIGAMSTGGARSDLRPATGRSLDRVPE